MGIGGQDETAFSFEGNWRELAPILFTNLMLSIVTLGIYRFWGIARERRYLWSKTRFIDDRLEWMGTGKELLIGFLLVMAILFVPLFMLQFVLQGLLIQGQAAVASVLAGAIYLVFIYVGGLAIFRGLRYRLSRTNWHGIRGGSADPGFRYGWSYVWKTLAGVFALGLLVPWSMTSLWSERWNRMSFGSHMFESSPEWSGLMRRYLLCYLAPVVALIAAVVAIIAGVASDGASGGMAAGFLAIALLFASVYIILPLAALAYYAAFFREMIGTLSLSTLRFHFSARTSDWLRLILGNIGLYVLVFAVALLLAAALGIATLPTNPQAQADPPIASLVIIGVALAIPLGLVGGFVRYRNWFFFIRHLEAGGEIHLATLTQSATPEPRQGEGLLDAMDIGGF